MKIHEYQAKELFRKYQIPVPNGKPAFSVDEAIAIAKQLSDKGPWVVKAQIHAGGRGKGGGVKVAKTMDEVALYSKNILGMKLVTVQTGPEGKIVQRLLIEDGARISKEYYVAITLDRAVSQLCIIASPEGGMDIEEVAEKTPHRLFKQWIHPTLGLRDFQTRTLANQMGFTGPASKQFQDILKKLVRLFMENDCTLAEINPLVLSQEGMLSALDAKLDFDENGMFRHPSFQELRDLNEEDPSETAAKKFDLSYISLDGNIGCMVNGAGLAMATMDIIKLEGGNPANFLDVGGGATEEKVKEAFKIILQDSKVKAILVNIFGGIMKCDVIAKGIMGAARELNLTVPLVVRLEGTNVAQGKQLLEQSGLKIITASGMKEAAMKAVAAAGGH
ncbi:ADP-forming succinate--CoA ligase subunit beta [bacterium]|nr:ADP-forming succinate--CoA ligase subunit beta [bacterium]NBX81831.1 ADP-forming succinate--CoA ligase subunit beta [bacterium]